jgi:hypothetical protein
MWMKLRHTCILRKDGGLYLVNTCDTKCDDQSYRTISYLAKKITK